jgi:general secretion pathway protein D
MFLSGCSSITIFKKEGLQLLRAGEYDKAVKYFEDALKKHPGKTGLRTLLFRAKLNSYYYHLALARRFKEAEKKEEAVQEYRIVLGIFPGNKQIMDELDDYLGVRKEKEEPFKSFIKSPVSLKVDPTEKITLNLRNTPIKQIFKMLGKSNNVNFIFDKDFRDFVYTIEIENTGFYDVLNQLCMVGSAEYRVLDPSSVLIYPSTTFKKRTFSLQGVKVFFLSNIAAEDAKKMVMTLFRDQQILIQEDKNLNSLIIKGTSTTLRAIEKFIHSIDKEKSEVEIEVEILELSRNLINAIGTDYGDTLSKLTMGVEEEDGTITAGLNVQDLGDTNFFITLPSAAINFLESDSNSKIIAKPNLRGVDGEDIKFMVGDEIPIPQMQLQPAAAGGVSNIPVTSYTYKNVGVEVKITPFINRSGGITLKLKLSIKYISGYTGDFPTLGKRELESIIQLKDGESSIIGGFIRDEMRKGLQGMPGLAKIPILGKLFGSYGKTLIQTDLVFSITPRIVRQVVIKDEDQGAIWSDVQIEQSSRAPAPEAVRDRAVGRQRGNAVVISPQKRRVKANSVSYFTLRVNSTSAISSLSISGSVSGAKAEIEELKTDFFGAKDNAKVLKNTSGDSFDLGYTFESRPIKNNVVAQLKIKFLEKGNYTLSLSSVSAFSKDRKPIDLTSASAEIEVY